VSRYKIRYKENIIPAMQKRFDYQNVMEVPVLEKIVINMGLGEGIANSKVIEAGVKQLSLIAGQKPTIRKAKTSISNFKLRKGMPIGVAVTLRGVKMFDFMDRLVNIAMPEIRDFRGQKTDSFDGNGNFTFAIEEQIVFPEIDYDMVDKIRGLSITFVTSAKTDEEAKALLEEFGFPFVRS
jgi:large subunit ribosomal protein L5